MDENRMAKDQDQLSEKELVVVAGGNDDSDASSIVSDVFSDDSDATSATSVSSDGGGPFDDLIGEIDGMINDINAPPVEPENIPLPPSPATT